MGLGRLWCGSFMLRQAPFIWVVGSMWFSFLTRWPSWALDLVDTRFWLMPWASRWLVSSLTEGMRVYFGPTTSPLIRTEWLQGSILWSVMPTDIHLRRFFMYFLNSFFFGNNWSVLTCQLLWALRAISDIGSYDWGSVIYGFYIALLRRAS